MVQSKTTGEPIRQATHSVDVDQAMSDVKLHNQIEKEYAFTLSYFN